MIPVYNELEHLETFLAQVDRASFGIPKELVFVDDCSTDPISCYPRARIDGKKISWRDGVAAVWQIIRFDLLVSDADCFSDALPARYVHAPGMPRQTLIDRDSVA